MTIKDFGNDIEMSLLQKGYNYYTAGNVDDLEKVAPGLWLARVHGSETYSVEIRTNKTQIKAWECDCPYDDYGSICKHLIAVFYAISEEMDLEKTQPKTKKTRKNKVGEIFKKISKEQLEQFVVAQFSRDRGLKNIFVAHFAELLDEDLDVKYKTIVRNLYKAALGRDGFIDYYSTKTLTNPLFDLLAKAEQFQAKNNISEALAISKTLIEEVPEFLQYMDDSNGEVGGIIDQAFDIFHDIAIKSPPMLKDDLFEYCLAEYPKEKYHDFGFDEYFLNTLPFVATTGKQENHFLNLIDKQIEEEKKTSYPDYGIVKLIKSKIDYFQRNKREKEAIALIEANIEYKDFREILVNKAILNADYAAAKELCLEGIIIAKNERHSGTENYWYGKLLEIAEKAKETLEIRKWAEKLYFDNHFYMKYYKKLKSTYKEKDWPKKCKAIINKLTGKNERGSFDRVRALANIFVEERYTARLLKLVQLNSNNIALVDAYSKYLQKEYPAEILSLYEKGVKECAINTGRGVYNEVSTFMKKMEKINGGEEKVKEMIQNFKIQYKMRPAMMEILSKNFPNTF